MGIGEVTEGNDAAPRVGEVVEGMVEEVGEVV